MACNSPFEKLKTNYNLEVGESGKAGGYVFLDFILLPSPSPHGEFGSSLHLVVRALTQVSRLQGSFYISVQWLSHVQLFGTPWIAARQASLSVTNSWSLFKLKSIESVMPSNPLLSPSPPAFNLSQHQGLPRSQFFPSGGQSIGVSALASVLPRNIQDWFPLGWTGWISSQSKGLSRVFSNTTVQKHLFFSAQLSL